MLCRLSGISFVDMPYLHKGDVLTIIREVDEEWDCEARPAYSVRLEGYHVGYIPLVETIKEEAIRGKDGFRKIWASGYGDMDKDEFRQLMAIYKKEGTQPKFHDWEFVGKERGREIGRNKMRESETVEIVRDWLYVEIMRNHMTPVGRAYPVYYDADEGRNTMEIGDVCSVSIALDDMW